jgi:hypothetical protein
MTTLNITDNSQAWVVSEKTVESQRFLKVPIALIGEWDHPTYGKVRFDQQDFNDIVQNWSDARAGYEPPLFLGHPVNNNGVLEGEPAAGWPDKIYQEDGVLYGLFTPTDDELYSSVAQKRYRYASAEVIRNARDKETGERIGTLLIGTALTNRPFLPLRDHTVEVVEQRFSDFTTPTIFTFDLQPLGDRAPMPDTVTLPPQEASQQSAEQKLSAPIEAPVPLAAPTSSDVAPVVSTVPKEQYDALVEEFSNLAKEFSTMKQQFSEVMSKEKERGIQEKLNKLEALNLPASTKQSFSELIKNGDLSQEAEDKLFSDYQQLSDNYKHVFATPQGVQEDVAKSEKEVELPQYYADIINRNAEVLKAKSAEYNPRVLG